MDGTGTESKAWRGKAHFEALRRLAHASSLGALHVLLVQELPPSTPVLGMLHHDTRCLS